MSPIVSELGAFGVFAAGAFGATVGSFLNVLIHRLPRGESVVRPPSHCPFCGVTIRPLENVPLLSWLALRGRCRTCGARIPLRYPAVELITGLLWALLAWRAPTFPAFFSGVFLVSACLALLAIDAEFQILPDAITITGIFVGLALSFLSGPPSPLASLVGAALGAGSLYLLGWVWEKLRGIEAMGLGDVKMLGMIGAFLGPWGVLLTVLFASVSGAALGLLLIALRRGSLRMPLPFGVFLALGAMGVVFWGTEVLEGYRALWAGADAG
ncbi:MAG: A24 family peptidase [Thermoanaerobaculia bacterium]